MELAISHAIHDWQKIPGNLRRKLTRKDFEEESEMACLVSALYNEALRTTPLQDTQVEDALCNAYRTGSDPHLALELAGILQEKSEKLVLDKISALKGLLVNHTKAHGTGPATAIMMADLETDAFGIVVTSLHHDCKASGSALQANHQQLIY